MEERFKVYRGEDKESLKRQEFYEKMRAQYEEACFRAMHKRNQLNGEE